MGDLTIGLLHPGEMGAAVGQCLAEAGTRCSGCRKGAAPDGAARAEAAGLTATGDAGRPGPAGGRRIVSMRPPHAALDIARQVAGFGGVYVDANAISPATAREVAGIVEGGGASYVDGGIIGTPPVAPGVHPALPVRDAGGGGPRAVRRHRRGRPAWCGGEVGAASAVKMAYASWTKGSAALLLAARALARAEGVEDDPAGRVAPLPAGPGGTVRPRGRVRDGQGLALDRGDGGDRRDHGRGRPARGISPGRGRDLPPLLTS